MQSETTNKTSKQMEKIYLLNVLLYIDSIESVKKFISINKKCQEVSTMLRLYTKWREKDRDFQEEKYTLKGHVYIVDAYGTFEQNEESSYDIMVDDGDFPIEYPCLFKHIRESRLKVWD